MAEELEAVNFCLTKRKPMKCVHCGKEKGSRMD